MAITQFQKEQRKKHIGSSDMAAILGLDPYRSAYDVWLGKTGKLLDEREKENQSMYAGTAFEDGVLRFAGDQLGKLIRNQYRSADGLPLGANIDAIVIGTGEPVEAKTAGLYGPLTEEWGEDGTDEVPYRVLVQSHVHMLCVDKEVCHVAAFIGGRGFQMFTVALDRDVRDIITEKAAEFWDRYVMSDREPPDSVPSLDMIKRVRREPETTVEVDDDLVNAWLAAKEVSAEANKNRKQAEARLLAAMGTAEGAVCPAGKLTYFEQHRKGYEVKPSTYRVLRYKKNK